MAPRSPAPPAPLPPRPRARAVTKDRLKLEAQQNVAIAAHAVAMQNYYVRLAAYNAALDAYNGANSGYFEFTSSAADALTLMSRKDQSDGPPPSAPRPDPDLIFTHGRGSTLDNEAIVAFAEGYARSKTL